MRLVLDDTAKIFSVLLSVCTSPACSRGDGSATCCELGTSLIAIGTGEQLKALGRLLKVETPEV